MTCCAPTLPQPSLHSLHCTRPSRRDDETSSCNELAVTFRVTFASVAVALALVCASSVGARTARPTVAPLSTQLTRALVSKYVPLSHTGAIAVDLESGSVVYAHLSTTPFIPASNEKLPVAWAALVRLGPAYRFHTELYGVGTRQGATWQGDLVLKGFGDPTLTSVDLADIAGQVARAGIREVGGRVRGDESYYDRVRDAPGWKRGFVPIESPPLSALVVDRALGWPALSPPLLAAKALTAALIKAGVQVEGRPGLGIAPAAGVPLAEDRSQTLANVVRYMNHESDNFTAEMVLKQIGAVSGGSGSTAAGARAVITALAETGVPTAGLVIADGSGLSSLDRLTPAAIVGILHAAWLTQTLRKPLVRSLAVASMSGTMRRRLPQLKGVVRAKTGTTDLATALSGLIGNRYAFSVLENGSPVAYWAARIAQDRFVTLLANAG
jgi:serine-type D-Ala-D-Ala carboxypeptidase/endopeptidase (penicillin-binding protein 4)